MPHHIVSEFNLISRRISASPIVSAFIVVGALITELTWDCTYTILLIGSTFTIAGILGIWLVYSIRKPGRF